VGGEGRHRAEIIAFLRFKPTLLHDSDATSDMNTWPTPRSWQMASCVLTGFAARQNGGFLTGTSEIEAQLLEGTIGPAATIELVAFLRLFRQLPSIPEILLNPDTAPVPDEPSARIAIATALGRVLTDRSIAKGMRYLDRMPTELRNLAMRDAAARDRAITRMREFEQGFSKQVDDFLDFYPSHIARTARTQWPLPRGGLPLRRRVAQEVRLEARGAAHPQRRRLPRHHVG
jgi:hypothetical protein